MMNAPEELDADLGFVSVTATLASAGTRVSALLSRRGSSNPSQSCFPEIFITLPSYWGVSDGVPGAESGKPNMHIE